jgi:patatin-like phospholipase/acyl hydrolase
MTAKARADSKGPHKILTIDGGGIRGAMSVEILAKIESLVSKKKGDTLSDYFDYISGTSTGAILAAGLSLGWSVDKLRQFYEKYGDAMFDKASWTKLLYHSYDDEPLSKLMQNEIGKDITLSSDKVKTLLMMVMRNATTDSPWPLSNNPYAKYNDPLRTDNNGLIPLWQLVRASTAAPVYFPPESVAMGSKEFLFVDGAVTCYNNPSFQTFLMATAEPYGLNWETGEKEMLVVSVGTGNNPIADSDLRADDMHLFYNAKNIPSALMNAASCEQDFLCRTFGNCLWGETIDSEIGDMCSSTEGAKCGGPSKDKLFTYVRYNAELTRKGLDGLGLTDVAPEEVRKLDSVAGIKDLQRVGRAVANQHVKTEHFSSFL